MSILGCGYFVRTALSRYLADLGCYCNERFRGSSFGLCATLDNNNHGSLGQKLNIIPLHISIVIPCLKHCRKELLLRVGLIHVALTCQVFMHPILNRTFALQCFECSNMVEVCNGLMFNFCRGLP